MSKAFSAKNSQPPLRPVTTATVTTVSAKVVATGKAPDREWKKVKGRKVTSVPTTPKHDVLSPKKQRQNKERLKEAEEQQVKEKKTAYKTAAAATTTRTA